MKNITKKDLIKIVASTSNVDQITTKKVLEKFFQSIIDLLKEGKNTELRGFGQFKVIERKAKIGRNITLGKSVDIPAHKEMVFKFSKDIRNIF